MPDEEETVWITYYSNTDSPFRSWSSMLIYLHLESDIWHMIIALDAWHHVMSSSYSETKEFIVWPKSLLFLSSIQLNTSSMKKGNRRRAYFRVLWWNHVLREAILSFHLLIRCSSLGLTKENPAKADWSMESMRFLSAWERRGFSFRNSRSKLLQSLGDFCAMQFRNFSKVNRE